MRKDVRPFRQIVQAEPLESRRLMSAALPSPPATVDEGSLYALDLATPESASESFDGWTVDWGDGTVQWFDPEDEQAVHVYNDQGDYEISVSEAGFDGPFTAAASITVLDLPPAVTLGAAHAAVEGSPFTLDFSADDPGEDLVSQWTIDWGDGTTQTLDGATGSTTHTYMASGPYTIRVTATNEDGSGDAEIGVLVGNPPPQATLRGPGRAVPGQTRRFHGSAFDSAAGALEVIWSFGDGTGTAWLPASLATLTATKLFTSPGRYTVTMSVRDAGGAIVSVETTIKVSAAQLQSDPAHPHKKALFVGGTDASDEIRLRRMKNSGRYEVRINGKPQGAFRLTGGLFIYGQAGDDLIQLGTAVSIPAVIFGGQGDDRLRGGSAASVLSGGDGDDTLQGGGARDLLIGGLGADRVDGGTGQDILIAGDTGSSKSLWDLIDIMSTWSRPNAAVSLRVSELRDSLLGDEYLAADGHPNDVLRGAGGRDWALLDGDFNPHATRPEPGEIVTAA